MYVSVVLSNSGSNKITYQRSWTLRCEIYCVSGPSGEKIIDLHDDDIVMKKGGSAGQVERFMRIRDMHWKKRDECMRQLQVWWALKKKYLQVRTSCFCSSVSTTGFPLIPDCRYKHHAWLPSSTCVIFIFCSLVIDLLRPHCVCRFAHSSSTCRDHTVRAGFSFSVG